MKSTLDEIAECVAEKEALQARLASLVVAARKEGHTLQAIAGPLGVTTRQGARQWIKHNVK